MTRIALALVVLIGLASPVAADVVVVRRALPNGMTVLVREDPDVGVVAASLQVRAGSLFETEETAGITNFVQRVLLRGTEKRSALGIVEATEELGGSLETSGEVESAEIRGAAIARQWEPLLGLLAEVALEATFPATEIERERRLLLGQLQTRADNPFPRAFDTALRDLYGSHPYAWPALGRRESVAQISREALVAHYRSIYRPDRMVLAVSGNVPRAAVLAAAERLFRRLPSAARSRPGSNRLHGRSRGSSSATRGRRRCSWGFLRHPSFIPITRRCVFSRRCSVAVCRADSSRSSAIAVGLPTTSVCSRPFAQGRRSSSRTSGPRPSTPTPRSPA